MEPKSFPSSPLSQAPSPLSLVLSPREPVVMREGSHRWTCTTRRGAVVSASQSWRPKGTGIPGVTMNFSSHDPAARKTFVLLSINATDLMNETWGFRTLSWSVWLQRCPASSPGIFCYPECVPEVEKTWLLTLMAHLLPSLKGVGAPFAPCYNPGRQVPTSLQTKRGCDQGEPRAHRLLTRKPQLGIQGRVLTDRSTGHFHC